MSESIQSISLSELSFAFIPIIIALSILFKWSLNARNSLYAISRMLIQLLLIGHFLSYIFSADSGYIILLLLAIMVFASSWIALGTVKQQKTVVSIRALFNSYWRWLYFTDYESVGFEFETLVFTPVYNSAGGDGFC